MAAYNYHIRDSSYISLALGVGKIGNGQNVYVCAYFIVVGTEQITKALFS